MNPSKASGRTTRILASPSIANLIRSADDLPSIRRTDVRPGDILYVRTFSSLYTLQVLENEFYDVSGGWFDKNRRTHMRLTISGCTWGGSCLVRTALAACGLSIEFGNRVRTSPVQRIILLPRTALN